MLLGLEELKRTAGVYLNPKNLRVMPLYIRNWRDFLALDEKTYGVYARTIYNPSQRFLVVSDDDRQKARKLGELYRKLLENPSHFCGEENYRYQLKVGEFDGLPFANGWPGFGVVLVGEAPGRGGAAERPGSVFTGTPRGCSSERSSSPLESIPTSFT
ncbi:hypothetical protein [Thermococcus stetteri]|uniref:hypothetical protein n=1 Tax=Thermococcus stetteri TaxID=49900 RepID=UPI0031582736|nr:hypothetical protein [Thermococcus stetteri]